MFISVGTLVIIALIVLCRPVHAQALNQLTGAAVILAGSRRACFCPL